MILLTSSPRVVGAATKVADWAESASCRLTGIGLTRGITKALFAVSMITVPAAAQDCGIDAGGWDDVQRFRRCLGEVGLDWWNAPSGNTILHNAAGYTTNPTVVLLLLEAGADPNARNDDGLTPLHRGAGNSNPVVIAHLLTAGGDPNAMDNNGYTPLHYAAARSGNARAISRLLSAGADPQLESNDGRTPLHSALRYAAEQDVVSELVEAGATEQLTPLQRAALRGDSPSVASLLAGEADPNEVDAYGWRPLHFAVPFAGARVVSLLLEAGADPNAQTVGGATPLHLAAGQATFTVVADLLGAGADPNARDGALEDARTPLHYAALSNDDPSVVHSLLDAGADPALRDNGRQRPVDFARENDSITGSDAYRRLVVNQPSPLLAGRSSRGELNSTDEVRWGLAYYDEWSFAAIAGQRMVVTMESEELDAYLLVLRDDGTEVASDDDGGTGLNARVDLRASVTGQYTILATSADSQQTGQYVIRVEVPASRERADGDTSQTGRGVPWTTEHPVASHEVTSAGPRRQRAGHRGNAPRDAVVARRDAEARRQWEG